MASVFHFGFRVGTKGECEEWYHRLRKQSAKAVQSWVDHGTWADFTIEDPDGYHVQVYWEAQAIAL